MQPFTIQLSDDKTVSGRVSIPPTPNPDQCRPLLVLMHGGSYASDYFDASPTLSIEPGSTAIGIPVVSLDRPGYNSTTPIPPLPEDQSNLIEQAVFLHETVLPAVWEKYAKEAGAQSLVLGGHSIGAMVAVITAGLYATRPATKEGYPLSGLVTSGITSAPNPKMLGPNPKGPGGPMDASGNFVNFSDDMKDDVMIDVASGLSDPTLRGAVHAKLNHPVPVAELKAIRQRPPVWMSFTQCVNVPVLGIVGEHDALWDSRPKAMTDFEEMFKETRVERVVVGNAPHCAELSYQAKAVRLRILGFAVGCATGYKIGQERKK